MIVRIPFKPLPSFTEEITLNNIPYIFTFNWNSRGEFWALDIADREENPILSGLKLTNQNEILGNFVETGQPKGLLYVVDNTQSMGDLTFDSFTSGKATLIFEEIE